MYCTYADEVVEFGWVEKKKKVCFYVHFLYMPYA